MSQIYATLGSVVSENRHSFMTRALDSYMGLASLRRVITWILCRTRDHSFWYLSVIELLICCFFQKEGRLILALMRNLFILFQHVSSDAVSQPAMQLERQCFRRFVLRCSMLSSWYWFKTHRTRCKYAPPTAWGARSLSMPGSNHLKSLIFRKAQQPQSSLKLHCEHVHIGHRKQSRWV